MSESWSVIEGDCVEAMAGMTEASVDAIVTDPPYGLGFMGKDWDNAARMASVPPSAHRPENAAKWGTALGKGPAAVAFDGLAFQSWSQDWAVEALRVLKPGGHLLAFGGTRTYHRLTCAIEDAGFEIRDCLAWLYGSGFPKSLDVSKAIDKAAGAEREVVGVNDDYLRRKPNGMKTSGSTAYGYSESDYPTDARITAPATADAERWKGWGTALKPAFEPVVLARKPLSERNVAANVLRWSTGALNVDGCRIDFRDGADEAESKDKNRHGDYGTEQGGNEVYGDYSMLPPRTNYEAPGRWPANVVLDDEAAVLLDEQSGERPPGGRVGGGYGRTSMYAPPDVQPFDGFHDTGGASRFFYTPKADRTERSRGLAEYLPDKGEDPLLWSSGEQSPGTFQAEGTSRKARNHHPTVKPIDLMQWLCRLVVPKGGLVLDPFTGSGSTGIAALREGFRFVGIEREHDYCDIARARIVGDAPLFNLEETS